MGFQLGPGVLSSGDEAMECESECDEDEVQSQEAREDARRKQVEAVRKKLGLPELELDALPSSIASKMLTLGPTCFHSGCFLVAIGIPKDWRREVGCQHGENLERVQCRYAAFRFAKAEPCLKPHTTDSSPLACSSGSRTEQRTFMFITAVPQLRMVGKLRKVISSLQLVETGIGQIYAEGVVDGFGDESGAYCTRLAVCATVLRSEEQLRVKYKEATSQSGAYSMN